MHYIKNPNLPQNTVNKLMISAETPAEIVSELTKCGVEILLSPKNSLIEKKIAAHTDLNLLHIHDNVFICARGLEEQYMDLLTEANIQTSKSLIKSPYPEDVGLNVGLVGKYAVFNPKTISEHVFGYINKADLIQIHVKQGYTKCNIVPVSSEAIITEDEGMCRIGQKYLDVLCLPVGSIQLNGYKHGFIGGACGKLSKDTLAITGKLNCVNEYQNMIQFCKCHGVSIVELSNQHPIDIGSLIPITEV